MTGGGDINSLGLLPDKLKTEIALHVNLETLKKVRARVLLFPIGAIVFVLCKCLRLKKSALMCKVVRLPLRGREF